MPIELQKRLILQREDREARYQIVREPELPPRHAVVDPFEARPNFFRMARFGSVSCERKFHFLPFPCHRLLVFSNSMQTTANVQTATGRTDVERCCLPSSTGNSVDRHKSQPEDAQKSTNNSPTHVR